MSVAALNECWDKEKKRLGSFGNNISFYVYYTLPDNRAYNDNVYAVEESITQPKRLDALIATVITCLKHRKIVVSIKRRCTPTTLHLMWARLSTSLLDRFVNLSSPANLNTCNCHMTLLRGIWKRKENKNFYVTWGKLSVFSGFSLWFFNFITVEGIFLPSTYWWS